MKQSGPRAIGVQNAQVLLALQTFQISQKLIALDVHPTQIMQLLIAQNAPPEHI